MARSLPPGLPPSAKSPKAPPGAKKDPKPTKLEGIKEKSQGLRGRLPDELTTAEDHFAEAEKQLLKFHGIYQQDDRDHRKGGKEYQFMVRSRIPGGHLTAAQYLAHDALADHYANGTLRVTTRQGIQFHGILKGDLRPTLSAINRSLITTLSACGDVVRNVMWSPSPEKRPLYDAIQDVAGRLADATLPATRAYHEIWVDGEKAYNGQAVVEEPVADDPLYGTRYLPRKFKIGVVYPGDNSVDVYTQDVGLIAVAEGETLLGFNVLVGGGLGMTHKKPQTFPRLADPLAFVKPEEAVAVVRHIIGIQRDEGDRTDRRHARMKYLIHDWGLDRFRAELEKRLGYTLAPPAETPPLHLNLYLGWHEQGDGRWWLGLSVENGRIQDTPDVRLKTALRRLLETYDVDVRLTANHDILLTDLRDEDRADIEQLLAEHGVAMPEAISNARKHTMACPALPTCGLALAESERVMPQVMDQIEQELEALGLGEETLTIRMTGCPNGCARPYVADVGFVGRSLDQYTVFVGGRPDGTRLNTPFADLVPLDRLAATIRPLFELFREDRRPGESFGDFCHRTGIEALKSQAVAA